MKNKKAQVWTDFILNYGWAIIGAVVVLGVLAYFGVFSSHKFIINQNLTYDSNNTLYYYDNPKTFCEYYNYSYSQQDLNFGYCVDNQTDNLKIYNLKMLNGRYYFDGVNK